MGTHAALLEAGGSGTESAIAAAEKLFTAELVKRAPTPAHPAPPTWPHTWPLTRLYTPRLQSARPPARSLALLLSRGQLFTRVWLCSRAGCGWGGMVCRRGRGRRRSRRRSVRCQRRSSGTRRSRQRCEPPYTFIAVSRAGYRRKRNLVDLGCGMSRVDDVESAMVAMIHMGMMLVS